MNDRHATLNADAATTFPDMSTEDEFMRCSPECSDCGPGTCWADQLLTDVGRALRAGEPAACLDLDVAEIIERANNQTPAERADCLDLVYRVERDLGERPSWLRRLARRTRLRWWRSGPANALHRAGVRVAPTTGRRARRRPRR